MFWTNSFKFPRNECPSTSITFDHGEKLNIFFKSPISFFNIRVEMTNPFLSTHRERFKIFSFRLTIKVIWNRFPFWLILFIAKCQRSYLIICLKSYIYSFYHYLLFFCLAWMMSLMWYSMKILLFFLKMTCILLRCTYFWVEIEIRSLRGRGYEYVSKELKPNWKSSTLQRQIFHNQGFTVSFWFYFIWFFSVYWFWLPFK